MKKSLLGDESGIALSSQRLSLGLLQLLVERSLVGGGRGHECCRRRYNHDGGK